MSFWSTQRETRIGLDDDFTAPRPVEHFASFRRRGAAVSAATELQSLGFDVVVERRGLTIMLQATRDEVLGDYDGWGAGVERAARPASATQPPTS